LINLDIRQVFWAESVAVGRFQSEIELFAWLGVSLITTGITGSEVLTFQRRYLGPLVHWWQVSGKRLDHAVAGRRLMTA